MFQNPGIGSNINDYALEDGNLATIATNTGGANTLLQSIYNRLASIQPQIYIISASSVAKGNKTITGFSNKYLIKYLSITTTSTNWTLTLYQKNDYSTSPLAVITSRDGNAMVYLDLPWQDLNIGGNLYYNFNSASGSETHSIVVYAEQRT